MTSIAEALRLVPGVQVSRVNPSTWAISARGFTTQVADKMLVLLTAGVCQAPPVRTGPFGIFGTQLEGVDAKHNFQVRGSINLPHRVEADSGLRYVSHLPFPFTPAYFELDSRLGWFPDPRVEPSIIGRNLLHAPSSGIQSSPLPRSARKSVAMCTDA